MSNSFNKISESLHSLSEDQLKKLSDEIKDVLGSNENMSDMASFARLANEFDSRGFYAAADEIDDLIKKNAAKKKKQGRTLVQWIRQLKKMQASEKVINKFRQAYKEALAHAKKRKNYNPEKAEQYAMKTALNSLPKKYLKEQTKPKKTDAKDDTISKKAMKFPPLMSVEDLGDPDLDSDSMPFIVLDVTVPNQKIKEFENVGWVFDGNRPIIRLKVSKGSHSWAHWYPGVITIMHGPNEETLIPKLKKMEKEIEEDLRRNKPQPLAVNLGLPTDLVGKLKDISEIEKAKRDEPYRPPTKPKSRII